MWAVVDENSRLLTLSGRCFSRWVLSASQVLSLVSLFSPFPSSPVVENYEFRLGHPCKATYLGRTKFEFFTQPLRSFSR